MKTAISIPDDLFRAAEGLARRMGWSRSELYQRALAAFLDRNGGQSVTDALNDVYGSKDEGAEPGRPAIDPVLARMQRASLPHDSW